MVQHNHFVENLSLSLINPILILLAFMWESMINSIIMTTSMQLAEECLKQNEGEPLDESNNSFEGLELFAQTLETVLARIKVRFIDTIIRLEYLPESSLSGVGLEIHIKK